MACKSDNSPDIEKDQQEKTHCIERRKLLKIAVAGGALSAAHVLPGSWMKPVVDFITIPAHAQTTQVPPVCDGCQLSGLGVDVLANTFSATYTWSNCENIDDHMMVITGPGVINPLGYVQAASGPSGSRTFTNVSPYNATVFQPGETYTFTVYLRDAGNNVLSTCVDTNDTNPLVCGCDLSGLAVNANTNEFDASLAWTTCWDIAQIRLVITGPGITSYDDVNIVSNITDTFPYNSEDPGPGNNFQPDSTYNFIFTVEDAGNNPLSTCTGSVDTPDVPD